VSARRRPPKHTSPVLLFTFVAGAITALIWALLVGRFDAQWLLAYLIAINVVTLGFYGYDKLISGRKLLRVPERTLHTLAFAGGTPLALVAQHLFRHKTVKKSFRTTFWTLAILQILAIAVVFWLVRRP